MARRRGVLGRAALVAALLVAGTLAGAGYRYFGPYRGTGASSFVDIEHGMSAREIARSLASHGIVRRSWTILALRMISRRATLQAGEYRFDTAQTPWQVFDKIRRGDVFYEELTVPEGSNIFEIATLLEPMDLVDPAEFLKAAANPASIRDLDSSAPDLEGYLFPSTYRVTHSTTARQLCGMMTREFRRRWAALDSSGVADTHRIVTLASLVEKETAIPRERPLVAAVFENRLRANMPLQCDPTAVYAALLENRYRGVIRKADLASANPFNTYTHAGLPPGPIANAGVGSIQATLHPAATDYLYFVAKADGSGTHQFSANLHDHEQAVLAYRKKSRE